MNLKKSLNSTSVSWKIADFDRVQPGLATNDIPREHLFFHSSLPGAFVELELFATSKSAHALVRAEAIVDRRQTWFCVLTIAKVAHSECEKAEE
jgi:hypothetical protein